jgi:hypothetical protein
MLDTHDLYDPDRIARPTLDEGTLARLMALPFWDDAVTTEDGATRDLNALAGAETDPLVRQAVEMQAFRLLHQLDGMENERRMAMFDVRLKRPRAMSTVIAPVTRLIPGAKSQAA